MSKIVLFFLFLSAFAYSQSYEQLMAYSRFYNQKIDSFIDFMKTSPTVDTANDGVRQIVYEMKGFNVAIEERSAGTDNIGQIFIFQVDSKHAHSDWQKIQEKIKKDNTFKFVKAMYKDQNVSYNEMTIEQLKQYFKNKMGDDANYAVRYKRDSAFYTVSVMDGNMVATIDDKNY